MSYNVEIKIFGTVSDPEAIRDLVEAVSEESSLGAGDGVGESAFLDMLRNAAETGSPVTLSKEGYDDVFESVTNACAEAGLSYVQTIGEDFPTDGVAWNPGMEAEASFLINDGKPVLGLDEIRKAARKGLDEVNSLIDTVAAVTRIGAITIDPGFFEAYQAMADEDKASFRA